MQGLCKQRGGAMATGRGGYVVGRADSVWALRLRRMQRWEWEWGAVGVWRVKC